MLVFGVLTLASGVQELRLAPEAAAAAEAEAPARTRVLSVTSAESAAAPL